MDKLELTPAGWKDLYAIAIRGYPPGKRDSPAYVRWLIMKAKIEKIVLQGEEGA